MDDVVAVEVQYDDGSAQYFITWGRIQDVVQPEPLASLVLQHARSFGPGRGSRREPVRARVCRSLSEALISGNAPYFFECVLEFAKPIPFGPDYQPWCREREAAMLAGREIAYCGDPRTSVDEDAPLVWVTAPRSDTGHATPST